MNIQRCKKLCEICDSLTQIIEEEHAAFDNLPENLRQSDFGASIEEKLENLEQIETDLQDAISQYGE